jgi:DNA-binding Xre family transcriptional regulator
VNLTGLGLPEVTPDIVAMIICTLKQALKRKGWTRYRLEKESGITFPTLYAMFYGKSKGYSASVLNRLCATLRCKPGDLLKWEPDSFPRHYKNSK